MQCPRCLTENPPQAKFCLNCGGRLIAACPRCGTVLPPQARFCTACGIAIETAATAEAAPPTGDTALSEALQRLVPREFAERLRATSGRAGHERRVVTILFSDIKGSTALAAHLDPEELLEILNGAFEFLISPIYRYEGTLAHLLGDAILAFFGAPIAHEDDPERACRAALEIVTGARRYAERLEQERGIRGFNVRVGINTGLVVVGEVGTDLRVNYTAVGETINLAARMEQNAPAGGILITHNTYRHVQNLCDVTAQEPLLVKGLPDPVQTYLVRGIRPRGFGAGRRGVEGVETRMIGRDAELLSLKNALADAIAEQETRVVTVMGEAGVGKSRLIYEFERWIEQQPGPIFRYKGRASAVTQTTPYSIIRDLFADRFDILESDSAAAALAKFRAGMASILEPEKADLMGQMIGFDFRAAGSAAVQALLGSPSFGQLGLAYLAQYARAIVAQHPAVLLLEDAHWADDSSLDLVWRLVEAVPAAALLIVVVARPTLSERRPNWGEGQASHTLLALQPLSGHASRALVAEILQRAPRIPHELRDLVVAGAEGNPFYVEELIKMLIEDGVIVCGAETWTVALDRLAEVRVPPSLTGILQARLDALPLAERALLQRAAVTGRVFWDDVAVKLAADIMPQAEVGTLLGSLRQRELVFRRERSAFAETTEFVFKHNLLRDVAYETILLKLRRRYHAQVAGWLEAHAGERLGEFLRLIASHYELAGEGVKAAGYLRRAGEEAFKVSAYRDAQVAFERALAIAPPPSSADPLLSAAHAALLVALGRTLLRLSDYAAASDRLAAGLVAAKEAGEGQLAAAALIGLGEANWRQGNNDAAQRQLETGLAAAQACNDLTGMALAGHHLGWVAYRRGHYEEANRWGESSRAWYSQTGDRQGIAAALNELGIIAHSQGEHATAERYFSESLARCREIGDRRGTANALNNLGMVAAERDAHAEERAYYEQCCEIYEEIGERAGVVIALLNLGELCIDRGLDGEAWTYLRQALREATAIQTIPNILYVLIEVSRLHSRAGQHERAAELLGLALHHPASDIGITHEGDVETALAALRQALPADQLEAALARGAGLELGRVVSEILSG